MYNIITMRSWNFAEFDSQHAYFLFDILPNIIDFDNLSDPSARIVRDSSVSAHALSPQDEGSRHDSLAIPTTLFGQSNPAEANL